MAYLPSNNLEGPPAQPDAYDATELAPELADLVPVSPHQPYDMKQLVRAVLDGGDFLEYHDLWALNLICGFGRIGGRVVGVVANQPQVLAGVLDIDAAEKGPGLCGRATVSISRSSPSWMSRVSCRGPTKSMGAWLAGRPNCFTPIARRPCPKSR